jgi:hypothetical protein
MGKEMLIISQSPEDIAEKLHTKLNQGDQGISREQVQREVSTLWDSAKTPALRQFTGALAENVLRKSE